MLTTTGPTDGWPARARQRLPGTSTLVTAGAVAVAMLLLFRVYLLLARTNPTNADGAANAVQAWDMLHGNLLLHGWTVSDVPFWSTELPQYALIELVAGYGPDVPHLAAALTYTLLVVLAAAVAKGDATGRAAGARIAVTVAVLLTPAPGNGYAILLLIPDHTGTAVPLLVAWLVLARATAAIRRPRGVSSAGPAEGPRHTRTAVIIAVILAWTQIGDPLALFVGAVPLTVVSLVRLVGFRRAERGTGADPLTSDRFEVVDEASGALRTDEDPTEGESRLDQDTLVDEQSTADESVAGEVAAPRQGLDVRLALAGVGSVALAQIILVAVHAAGGFSAHPPIAEFASWSALGENFRITGRTLAVNFGAYLPDYQPGVARLAWVAHLVALLSVGVALLVAVGRLLARRDSDRVTGVLAVAIVVNLAAFVASTQPAGLDTARQIVPVLPLGAVLAGRVVADALLRARAVSVVAPFLGVLAVALALQAATARATPADALDVSRWLVAHGLRSGLGGYWGSHTITVNTGGRVRVAPTFGGQQILGYRWESRADWYDPTRNDARFIVFDHRRPFYGDEKAAFAQFGPPVEEQDFGAFAVWVYDRNLLADLPAYCVPEVTVSMAACPPLSPHLPGAGLFDKKRDGR